LVYFWILFNVFALGILLVDLRLHRHGRAVGFRAALSWSATYVVLAAAFAVLLYFWQGHQVALEFITGYVLEVSLSIDNLFVFLIIFNYFAVPDEQQHRVLFWGVLGALLLRGIFIGAGVGLISRFHWVLYVFGTLLIISGIRFCVSGDRKIDPARNPLVRALRHFIPVTSDYRGGKFFVRNLPDSRLYATPLLVVLILRGPCGYAECLHRIYLERICDSGTALAVFRSLPPDEDLPLLALRLGGRAGIGRNEDAYNEVFSDFHRRYVGLGCRRNSDLDRDLSPFTREGSLSGAGSVHFRDQPLELNAGF
jgi:Integral membrane protein TerC family